MSKYETSDYEKEKGREAAEAVISILSQN